MIFLPKMYNIDKTLEKYQTNTNDGGIFHEMIGL